MNANAHLHRARGLVGGAKANTGGAQQVLAELTETFRDFQSRYNGALEDINARVAALTVGGDGPGGNFREHSEGRRAFTEFLRTGNPQAGMRESGDPDGGYAVPTTVDATIQNQLIEFSPLRAWATVITLGAGAGTYSFLVNRRGAASGWVGEEEARPATDTAKLGAITPPEGEVYANASITQWLLDDSNFNLDQFIRDNILDEFAVQEGEAFVSGVGLKQPRGFLNYDKSTDVDADRAFGTLQYVPTGVASALSDSTHNGVDALYDVLYSLRPSYRAGPGVGWMMNSTTAQALSKLKDGDGRYLWEPGLREGTSDRLLGFPVALDENMPSVGANAFPVAFGNWRRGYRIVDRLGTRLLRDPYTNKPKVMFYMTKRVGGAVADSNAIKLLKVATT